MTRTSMLVGLVGSNIKKSLSSALHEDAFAAHGIRGHYHLMDLDSISGGKLEQLFSAIKSVGFAGINVTYPSKEAIIPLLDETSIEAQEIGAVNTVKIDRDGYATGFNTDRSGFRRSFEEKFGPNAIRDERVVLVGAGGAGRAVACALMDLGAAHVGVHDNDLARAVAAVADLISQFGSTRCSYLEDLTKALTGAACVVNATPVGMAGHPGNPVPAAALSKHHVVADIIYTPVDTELIKIARGKGCRVLTGGGMCVHQAADAFRLFTGLDPDIERMRRAFEKALLLRDLS